MPDPHKLAVLAELRRAHGLTLAQMAVACGLEGRKGREAASAWEQGRSIPNIRRRQGLIDYLGYMLSLRHEPVRFRAVWQVLAEEWEWALITEAEWRDHFPSVLGAGGVPGAEHDQLQHILRELSVLRVQLNQMPDSYERALGAAQPFNHSELLYLAQAHLQEAIELLGRAVK